MVKICYQIGQKIEYSFTEVLDFRLVEIEEITETHFKFKNKTGYWSKNERFIKPANFRKSKIVKAVNHKVELIYH